MGAYNILVISPKIAFGRFLKCCMSLSIRGINLSNCQSDNNNSQTPHQYFILYGITHVHTIRMTMA